MLHIDQHDEDGVSVVVLRGEASVAEAQMLTEVIIPLAAERPAKLLFDLSQLRFISSLALGEMSSLAAALRRFETRLAIAGASPHVRSGLHRVRLNRQYAMFDSVEEALAYLAGQTDLGVAADVEVTATQAASPAMS